MPRRAFEWKGSVLALAWSPDGRYVATGDQDAAAHFWILKTGNDLMMSGYQTKVRELSWEATGRYLATGGGGVPCVWDCSGKGPEGTRPAMLKGHEDMVTDLAFQRRGPLLATAGADGRVMLWHPAEKKRPLAEGRLDSGATRLAWAPDDHHLAAGAESGQVTVFAVP